MAGKTDVWRGPGASSQLHGYGISRRVEPITGGRTKTTAIISRSSRPGEPSS